MSIVFESKNATPPPPDFTDELQLTKPAHTLLCSVVAERVAVQLPGRVEEEDSAAVVHRDVVVDVRTVDDRLAKVLNVQTAAATSDRKRVRFNSVQFSPVQEGELTRQTRHSCG